MLTVRGGYHGDTFGAMSVCDPVGGMHRCSPTSCRSRCSPTGRRPPAGDVPAWADGVPRRWPRHTPTSSPASSSSRCSREPAACTSTTPRCLRVMREVADEHGLVLVLDEIATGFGRTGTLFAAEAAGVAPDVHVRRQGADRRLPHPGRGAVHGAVARGLSASESGVLMHGPTYMGNPLACAVALANLDLLADRRLARPGGADRARAWPPGSPAAARCPRSPTCAPSAPSASSSSTIRVDVDKATEAALDEGVWLRPFRNLVYTMPPYVSTDDDVARICAAIEAAGGGRMSAPMSWREWLRERAAAPRVATDCAGSCARVAPTTTLARPRRQRLPRPRRGTRPSSRPPTAAARRWGAGAGASRLVTGSLDLHADLEADLAAFLGQPAALVMSTGYHANLAGGRPRSPTATASSSPTRTSTPRSSTPSGSAGPRSRSSRTTTSRPCRPPWPGAGDRRALVVVESVYSVLGDAAPLRRAGRASCAAYDAMLVVDEAHGLGVAGAGGRGLVRDLGLAGAPDVVVTATLSKALGAQGGAVLGSAGRRRAPRQPARPFIFDTGLAPAAAGAARWRPSTCCAGEPELPALVQRAGPRARRRPRRASPRPAPCCRCRCPRRRWRWQAQAAAREEGVLVGCFRPPSVPDGVSRLRITIERGLADADWARATAVLGQVVKEYDARRPGDEPVSRVVVVTGTGTGVGKTIATAALAVRASADRVGRRREAGADRRRARSPSPPTPRWCTRSPAAPSRSSPRSTTRSRRTRRPGCAACASRRSPSTPTGSGCWRSPTTRCSSRARAGCSSGSTPTAARCSTSPRLARRPRSWSSSAAGLGTLNHTELTVRRAARARGIEPAGLVIGSWPADPGTGRALQPRRPAAGHRRPAARGPPATGAGALSTGRSSGGGAGLVPADSGSALRRLLVEEPPVAERVA